MFANLLAWAATHERKLGAALFAFGFLSDLLTFTLLPLRVIAVFFAGYLVLAGVATFGTHLISAYHAHEAWWRRTLAVLFPLLAHYALGGLFSGFVVFYAKNSVLDVSWPFIVLLLLVYAGNEYFRKHREHLVFQTVLFFFALYAYLLFELPILLGSIGPWTFLGSTLATVILFALFLWLLRLAHAARLSESFRDIVRATSIVLAAVILSYFSGLIPPIPLALKDAGIFHGLTRTESGYQILEEAAEPWWQLGPKTIHSVPGQTLYAYSAVVAPFSFLSTVVHRWERHTDNGWITETRVTFPLSGGREAGYRGYSAKQNLVEGKWRVSVETQGGQTIGRIRFNIARAVTTPILEAEIR